MGSRPPRTNYEHAYHHVTSRGTDQWLIFLDNHDRRKFLHLLARICHRYGVEVVAYCLMGNHFHLVLYFRHANLSPAMRDLKSGYANYYNQRHRRTGPVFGSRFFARVITDERQLVDSVRYTHRNPLDIDPDIALASYAWSSHAAYLGLCATPKWLRPGIALEMMGANYRAAVEEPRQSDKVQNRPRASVHAPGARTLMAAPSLAEILLAVAQCADCEADEVRPGRRNGLIGLAILAATDLGGYSPGEIAEPFGFKSSSAVIKQLQRTRQRIDADVAAGGLYRRVERELGQRKAA